MTLLKAILLSKLYYYLNSFLMSFYTFCFYALHLCNP